MFFHFYGLDRDAAEDIRATFSIVAREEVARWGRFRSRDRPPSPPAHPTPPWRAEPAARAEPRKDRWSSHAMRAARSLDGRVKPGHDSWTGATSVAVMAEPCVLTGFDVMAGLDPAIHALACRPGTVKLDP